MAAETVRLGLQGRVTGSHLTSLHSVDNYYFSKLIALMAEAKLNVIANPLINITIQGRHDTYPKRRGMTRVPEFMAAGFTVAFGQDCVMDPWYSMGSGDMLEVAHMAVHVGQMTGLDAQACFSRDGRAGADHGPRRLWPGARLQRRSRRAAMRRPGGGDPPETAAAVRHPPRQSDRGNRAAEGEAGPAGTAEERSVSKRQVAGPRSSRPVGVTRYAVAGSPRTFTWNRDSTLMPGTSPLALRNDSSSDVR
jgi:hypothetical protein